MLLVPFLTAAVGKDEIKLELLLTIKLTIFSTETFGNLLLELSCLLATSPLSCSDSFSPLAKISLGFLEL